MAASFASAAALSCTTGGGDISRQGREEQRLRGWDSCGRCRAGGMRIQRCQDLPAEAFGNPEKALYIITASHRWLDRYTCDVPTPEFPEGLRLGSMLKALDEHFSPVAMRRAGSCWRRFIGLETAYFAGGYDVLIFFDFAAIPQNGLHVSRTLEEIAR